MTKRRVKKTVKQSAASSQSNINDANAKEPQLEKRKDSLIDQEGMFSYLFVLLFFCSQACLAYTSMFFLFVIIFWAIVSILKSKKRRVKWLNPMNKQVSQTGEKKKLYKK